MNQLNRDNVTIRIKSNNREEFRLNIEGILDEIKAGKDWSDGSRNYNTVSF